MTPAQRIETLSCHGENSFVDPWRSIAAPHPAPSHCFISQKQPAQWFPEDSAASSAAVQETLPTSQVIHLAVKLGAATLALPLKCSGGLCAMGNSVGNHQEKVCTPGSHHKHWMRGNYKEKDHTLGSHHMHWTRGNHKEKDSTPGWHHMHWMIGNHKEKYPGSKVSQGHIVRLSTHIKWWTLDPYNYRYTLR